MRGVLRQPGMKRERRGPRRNTLAQSSSQSGERESEKAAGGLAPNKCRNSHGAVFAALRRLSCYNKAMQIRLSTPPDFSFTETLSAHGWRRLRPFVWLEETQTLERAEEMPDGNVALLRMGEESGQIVVSVEGEVEEAELTRRVQQMLQLDLPLTEFHDFCRQRPELAHLIACKKGRMLRSPTLWEDVVKVIATTNTTWTQTIAMTARLVESFGAEGRAFPGPERIAALTPEEFAAGAKMGYRNASVHAIATRIAGGGLDLETWQTEGIAPGELQKCLLSLPGVGPYAAACLMLYLGRPQQVNADSWARMLLSKELGQPVTDKEVHAFFAGYGEWRGLVYNFYPWRQ